MDVSEPLPTVDTCIYSTAETISWLSSRRGQSTLFTSLFWFCFAWFSFPGAGSCLHWIWTLVCLRHAFICMLADISDHDHCLNLLLQDEYMTAKDRKDRPRCSPVFVYVSSIVSLLFFPESGLIPRLSKQCPFRQKS